MSVQIAQEDVIRLILQYLKENSLNQSYKTLQLETKIALNTIDTAPSLSGNIIQGLWELVLKDIQDIALPIGLLMDIYEQIITELLELNEKDTASALLKDIITSSQKTATANAPDLRTAFPERVLKLEMFCKKAEFDYREAFHDTTSKEKRRRILADKIKKEMKQAAPARLLQLLGQSLKQQEIQGTVKPNVQFNIFTGEAQNQKEEHEKYPNFIEKTVDIPCDQKVHAIVFASNGQFVAVGDEEGMIEVWDSVSGKIRMDLAYQAEDQLMHHPSPVLCLALSRDNELLVSGDKEGNVKVWRVSTGKCLKRFDKVHPLHAISHLCFGNDISHLLVCAAEIKLMGLKSGKMIAEFRGHTLSVNAVMLFENNEKMMSGGMDGMLRLWNYATSENIQNFRPPSTNANIDCEIFSIIPLNKEHSEFIVANRSTTIFIMNIQGNIIRVIGNEPKNVEFVAVCVSSKRKWLYALGVNNILQCYNLQMNHKLEHSLKIASEESEKMEVTGLYHHPLKNLILVNTFQGKIIYLVP